MNAIILAGGRDRAEQLLPLAYPTHLLPVANRSLIEHQLAWLAREGVKTAIVAVDHRGASLASPPPAGLEVRVHYSPGPMGLAAAVALARAAAPDDQRVLLIDGSVLTLLDVDALIVAHERSGAAVTAAVPRPGSRRQQFDRPLLLGVAAGASIVAWDAPGRPGATRYVAVGDYWRDLRTPDAYLAVQLDALAGRLGALPGQEVRPGVFCEGAAHILSSAELTGRVLLASGGVIGERATVTDSVVGAGCIVASEARVERSVLLDGARIGRGAVVLDSIVGPCAAVSDGAAVTGGSVVGPGAQVRSGQRLSQASVA